MHPLSQKLELIERRLIWQRRALAACRVLATALITALILGLIDDATRSADPGLRIMATSAFLAVIAWAGYRWWYVPAQQPFNSLIVGRKLEAQFPLLQDSLASAIEFLQQSEDDQQAGSPQLRRLVIANAAMSIESLPLDEVIDRVPLRKAAIWLGLVILLSFVCFARN